MSKNPVTHRRDKNALSSEVSKAEEGSKIGTTPAEKKEMSVNKSPPHEINAEDYLVTTILSFSILTH